ncbi:MAG: DNA polymerase III subunit gamma/tau, partial [Planctomycetia bacterium]
PAAGYQVVARRYRPQLFADLVGQEHVARGLSGAIESGRIGHAYLFTGARGVGKTSAARIYAKALECATGPAAEPCNQCDSCVAISAGQDVDVVEIDAASNRGVEEIRQLRQNVAVRPARGRFKVYIIDEVHMLTREAFNALLKTLEEPPGHVKFVLCTTEPDKLPITILSRCQRFDFQTVDVPAIARRLAQIVEAEGAEVAPVALDLIARRAAGSMRDSQSLLEQLLGAASGPIGVDDVHAVIGTGREERIGRLVAAIANRDAKEAIAAFDASLVGGADPGGVLEQVIAALRDALLASVGCGPDMLREGAGLGVDLAAIGRQIGTETILAMLQIVDQALARMRTSGHAAVLAEMAIVRLANLENLDTLTGAIDRVSVAAAAAPATSRPTAAEPPREKKTTDRAREAESTGPLTPVAPGMAAAVEAIPQDRKAEAAGAAVAMAEPLAAWRQAAEAVGGLVADFAAEATHAAWRGNLLDVTIPSAAATAVTFLRRPQSISSLGTALSDIVGRDVKHSILVEKAEPDAAVPGQAQATATAAPPRPPMPSQSALVREAMEHPMVVHARTLFDAAIRKVEPARQPAAAVPAASSRGDDGDELDHRDDDASEPDLDPAVRGGDGDG